MPEWQKYITNLPSRADLFAATVSQYLGYVNTSGNMSVQRLSAIFGVYGELPLVAMRLDDCFVLMDPLAGNLSGPFAPDSVLDARGLLSAYEGDGVYQPGTGVRYLTSQGCPTTMAKSWQPGPPTGTAPIILTPSAVPSTPLGCPAPPATCDYLCKDLPGGGKSCARVPTTSPAAPGTVAPTVPFRINCIFPPTAPPNGLPNPSAQFPNGEVPWPRDGGDPPAVPAAPAVTLPGAPHCVIEYFW